MALNTAIDLEPNPFRRLKMILSDRIGRPVMWPDIAPVLGISPSRMRRLGCGSERPFNPRTARRWDKATDGLLSVEEQLAWAETATPRSWGRKSES